MTDKEIALLLNNWIAQNVEYDYGYDDLSYTGYGALFEGKAVCLGYVALYNRMLSLFGIEAIGIIGEAKATTNLHIWSEVILDNQKYFIDVTWNDKGDTATTQYFTTDKEKFKEKRTWDEDFYKKYKGIF